MRTAACDQYNYSFQIKDSFWLPPLAHAHKPQYYIRTCTLITCMYVLYGYNTSSIHISNDLGLGRSKARELAK